MDKISICALFHKRNRVTMPTMIIDFNHSDKVCHADFLNARIFRLAFKQF